MLPGSADACQREVSVSVSKISLQATTSNPTTPPPVKASSQGILCLWHGLTVPGLVRLLMKRPPVSWSQTPRLATIMASSAANSLLAAAETVVYSAAIRRTRIEHPPVFILGHWRSGTTMLHNLLCLDPHATYPNLYQCLNPQHFLLSEHSLGPLTSRFLPKTRPMDNIPVGWGEPQEEDIALALDCGISPYLMLAFNDRPDVYCRYFDPQDMTESERARWKHSLMTFMKKLTIRRNTRIVSKNPGHTFRIPILLEMFPNAKFIYIRRNPYAVYQSTMHLRKTMFSENSLAPARLESCSDDTLHFYEKCIRTYEETRAQVPEGNLHELRFEDLEADPLLEVGRIYQNLQLPGWEETESRIQAQLPQLKSYRKNAFRMDTDTMQMVYARLRWVFELYGYPSRITTADPLARTSGVAC
jgi:hypothetical protein